MADPEAVAGQVAPAPQGTTGDTSGDTSKGQSASPSQTTKPGPDTGKQESFFDPESIKHSPELQQAYKQMQGTFSKKMADVSSQKQKIDAYDQAMRDPNGTIRQLAKQYGLTVVEGGPDKSDGEFAPKSWADVVEHISAKIRQDTQQQYAPLLGEVRTLKQKSVESQLDANFSDWRTYEQDMIKTLQAHPSMANDPDSLYRLSVPAEVLEARATERALKKLKGSTDAGAIPGAGKTLATTSVPSGKLSLNDAVVHAKNLLRAQGIKGPVGEP